MLRFFASLAPVLCSGLLSAASVALSPTMSLAEIEEALVEHPPRWEDGAARAAILESLDHRISVQIRKGWTDEERAHLQPVREFYLRRIDIGLAKLESTRVTTGVHVFKFYSSSYVFRTAAGTVAVDFCQGPVNNAGEPEKRDEYGSGFYLRPDQRNRLARQVDVFLITHRHHDHADFSLARRLIEQGKRVVGPAQLKTQWKTLAAGLTVPNYGSVQRFGPAEIFTMLGYQYSRNEPTGVGTERRGVPNRENPSADSETVVYLFKLAGITFLTGGENHVPGSDWLQAGVKLGFKPQVRLSLGQFQGERALLTALSPLTPTFRLPLHEYEMMHEHGGNRTGPLLRGGNRTAYEQHRLMPLVWGEDFLLTDELVAFAR
jgi:L-ascorbate metabolism protein UlaG (beta-lactamase superfamily)